MKDLVIILRKSYHYEDALELEHEVGAAYENTDFGEFKGTIKVLIWYEPTKGEKDEIHT